MSEPVLLELQEVGDSQPQPANLPAVADNSASAMMLAAMGRGFSPEQIEKMLDLRDRFERREAEKAYNEAMAAFSAEAIEIIKSKHVTFQTAKGVTDYWHAELSGVVEAVKPALARHGFSYRWDTEQSQDWLNVTCILRHRLGHSESCTLGGPPDDSGGKNRIQAVKSTKSYLERQTLEAICGVAEKGEDNDGADGAAARSLLDTWIDLTNAAETLDAVNKVSKDGAQVFTKAKDVEGYRRFASEVARRRHELNGRKGGW